MQKVNNGSYGEGTIFFDEFVVTNDSDEKSTDSNTISSSTRLTAPSTAVPAANSTVSIYDPRSMASSTTIDASNQTIYGADSSASSTLFASVSAAPTAAKPINTGAIVAAVLVGLFVILALGGFFLFWRNRKNRRLERLALIGMYTSYSRLLQIFMCAHPAPIPYNSSTPGSTHPLNTLPFDLYSLASLNPSSLPHIGISANHAPINGQTVVELKQRAKAAILGGQNQLQYPIQHIDDGTRRSGSANLGGEQLPMDLPPVYSDN
jgi:hypothetical protein